MEKQQNNNRLFLRDPKIVDRTDANLDSYLAEHQRITGIHMSRRDRAASSWSGLTRRIALSCLIDADWGDTATHFGKERHEEAAELRWAERLDALDRYVKSLQCGLDAREQERNRLRARLYAACREADTRLGIRACEAPVGTGKTTAIMAHLLRVANANGLRRIFVVLPYTNIIQQAVQVYRKSLVLAGEKPEEIVAEHHHLADFKDLDLRGMSEKWIAPIVVTTAVQFFETLGNHLPARLRKLHRVPRSAIVVDEAHAAIPAHLWPQNWLWLRELAGSWDCHLDLASGSLVRFWESPMFLSGQSRCDVSSVVPSELNSELAAVEKNRIRLPPRGHPMSRKELIEAILSKPGPRLVIMNTVQSAAVIANEMRKSGCDVLHLSTALAPAVRASIVVRIKARLATEKTPNWTLVATSCVEAGMDFDFRTAFRESASVCSLLQTAGRVNRHGRNDACEVIDFRTNDPLLNRHPAFERSRHVLDELYDEGLLAQMNPDEAATTAFERECETGVALSKAEQLVKAESNMDYPEVGRLNRVIDADTRLVIVDQELVNMIKNRQSISSRALLLHSVQMWSERIRDLGLELLDTEKELFCLGSYRYDPAFLGYMEGLLPLVYRNEQPLTV